MTPEFESRATWITEAADELGVGDLVTELPKDDAAATRRRIEETFLVTNYDWWWERLKSGYSFWSEAPSWKAIDAVAAFSGSGPVWLLPVYDDKGEVFRVAWPIAIDILRKSNLDEFALVADDLAWMLIINHHNGVFGSGARAIAHLKALEQRPDGQGAPTPRNAAPPPPVLGRAQVLRYATSSSFRQIGKTWVTAMAICRATDRDGVHLLSCDVDWTILEDTHCASVKDAEKSATKAGASALWITMAE